jgi:endonuclease/exonuclease/phosphatase family metal-dependent hydrolase
MTYKILFSNLGYARGIDGTLGQHLRRAHRHVYIGSAQQQEVLSRFKDIIRAEKPDVCCMVEIDSGSWNTGRFSQIGHLVDDDYAVHDIAGKYGEDSVLARMPFFKGKCNAFLSKAPLPYRRLYFKNGSKRLLYSIVLPQGITLFFGHFSLNAGIRARQLEELGGLVRGCGGEAVVMADFNILNGSRELRPLLEDLGLRLLNREDDHTFRFGGRLRTLDLCLCSERLAALIDLRVIPQPFSDHAALLASIRFPAEEAA